MRRRLAALLTAFCLLGSVSTAWGQSAVAVVQQIHDQSYAKCIADARFGTGSELQANCSCSADVVVDLLSEEFKQAIAGGTHAGFKGQKLAGDEMSRNVTLLKTCPNVGAYLQQQCAATPDNPHCQILEEALKRAQ